MKQFDPARHVIPTEGRGRDDLVVLDPDHPGFRDPDYRRRRNEIARLALEHRDGDPVPEVAYLPEEHAVWSAVWERLAPAHEALACSEYRRCCARVPLDRGQIPQLAEVNRTLAALTGVQMMPVAGLVSERTFLTYLARDVFLATQYIRHHSRPLYTPEPDVVHEVIGHAITFADPGLAAVNRKFGEAAAQADRATIERVARVYWYTFEFGAVREGGSVKAYGAGLLSSAGELERLRSPARLAAFDLEEMASTPYDPTDYQPCYFVGRSFDTVMADLAAWLDGARAAVRAED